MSNKNIPITLNIIRFKKGQQLQLKKLSRSEYVVFLCDLTRQRCKIINAKGLIEAVYKFELEPLDHDEYNTSPTNSEHSQKHTTSNSDS